MPIQIAILFLLFCVTASANAADTNTDPDANNIECYLCSLLDRPQLILSKRFIKLSDRLDIFFSRTRSYDKYNKSFASLNYYIISEEDQKPSYLFDTRVYLTLPRTQERMTFRLQTEGDSELDSDNPDLTPGTPDKNTNAIALGAELASGERWRIITDIGAEYRNGYDPFIRLAYNHNYKYGKWTVNWREAIFRFSAIGNGITSSLTMERNISNKYILRISNKAVDYIDEDYIEPIHSISLSQQINNFSAIAYTIGQFETHQPADRTNYLQLRFKRLIHKTWLYYEVIPEILYADSNNHNASGKVSFKLEYLIGNY